MNNNERMWTIMLGCVIGAGMASTALGYTFQCRFVERVGNVDVPLFDNVIDATNTLPRNIRMQLGVFDDSESPAPEGGLIGWTSGFISVGQSVFNSSERRNPGRLAPFDSPSAPTANGDPPLPFGDPFTDLVDIDATTGNQRRDWLCDGQGTVPPAPQALVRGRNTFVSVYAFSIDPNPGAITYNVYVGGSILAATSWAPIPDSAVPPDCGNPADPSDDVLGSIGYSPILTEQRSFESRLGVAIIPAPGAAVCAAFAAAGVLWRRRW